MANEHWTDRLSEYLDGELDAGERTACEAHIERCEACSGILAELREVAAGAALLPDVPPGRDLWPDIRQRLAPRGASPRTDGTTLIPLASRRRVSFTWPQLAAAVVAVVMLSASGAWLILPHVPGMPAGGGAPALAAASPLALTASYDAAVNDLEREFADRRDVLDPETVRVVEANLAVIDDAIAEARQALAEDPASPYLNTHLTSAMRQKVDLLRQVTALDQTEI